ncbi:hypothetical protein [Methylomagnum ishizawai]|uniref:hypothetical protein n=1 Tax=Methylomagnum ishizawai TaxID=1760988 RepID=UPI001C33E60B|nr:hypothetical protein [Methylomagnum ishizawai]BBL74165.1 hypothetical protein MishRS11D_12630 [Methylomagnum ishizawai]
MAAKGRPGQEGQHGDDRVRVVDIDDGRTLSTQDIADFHELINAYRALRWLLAAGIAFVMLVGFDKLYGFVKAHWVG